MRTKHVSTTTLVAGILSISLGACGSSANNANNTSNNDGKGGSTNPPTGSGGSILATGGSSLGGAVGSGGSSLVGTGGGNGGGGSKGLGGTVASSSTGGGGHDSGGKSGTTPESAGGATDGGSTSATGIDGGVGTGGRASGGTTGFGGATGTGGKTSPGTGSGTCTASKAANVNASGSGPHKVVVESNSDAGVACGTIYRPADLGGTEKYPIFVWGEGACTRSGTSDTAAMAEIASYGYFVVADGPANGGGNCPGISMSTDYVGMGKPLLGYITWAIAENEKSCSAYYQSLDTTKVAADGFSCGGLMASGTAADPRMTTYGITSSGLTGPDQTFYKSIHTPVKILLGGSGDIAYSNGERDYDSISALGIPIVLFSKAGAGHGGDLGAKNGGDFTKVNLAWLNWQLKGDVTATGKGFLVGASCTFCTNSAWEVKSKNLP
jgi:hypothetical protein